MKRVFKAFTWMLTVITLCAVLAAAVHVGSFTTRYHTYWSTALREHDDVYKNQVMTTRALMSQQRWEDQASFNLHQLQHSHQELVLAERKLKATQFEHYHFLRTLEKIDPEALKATLADIKKPRLKIPFFNIPLEPTPAECEDGQCEENSSN